MGVRSNPYPVLARGRLPFLKRVFAKITPVRLYTDSIHFSEPTDIYLSYCKKHRVYYLDYLHGFPPEQYVLCPICILEERVCEYIKESHGVPTSRVLEAFSDYDPQAVLLTLKLLHQKGKIGYDDELEEWCPWKR